MKRLLQATVVLGLAASPASAAELTVITAGDQNMVDYINEYLAPIFEKENPGNTVRVVGTGPGDAGSQKIVERFEAQKQAGSETWDTDVAVAHEKFIGPMIEGGYLESYRDKIATGNLVTRSNADMALGTKWVYAFGDGDATKLMNGPFDEAETKKWDGAFASLKDFTQNATLTPGNAGTLDLLSRGEIAMGPVWVDMFYSWQANGQLPPDFKLVLPAPGMPGQPMHYVIPAKSPNKELAEKFVELATSPKVQAEGIVKRFNWYPGIDAQYVQPELDEATWKKLFTDVTPDDLAKNGKPFPIAPYNNAILEAYERQATN
jgi:putative spermidine/putrescine transport system substrate-binding protein